MSVGLFNLGPGGGMATAYNPATDTDLALWLTERNGSVMSANIGSPVKILTPVAKVASNANGYIPSDGHIYTTESFAIECLINIESGSTLISENEGSSTSYPGYSLRTTQFYLASNVSQIFKANHNLNIVGQGWVHCFIVVNRTGYLDAYRNGVRVLHTDISAKASESITNSGAYFRIGQSGTYLIGKIAYINVYKFSDGVPANIGDLVVDSYAKRYVTAELSAYCTHMYLPVKKNTGTCLMVDFKSDSVNYGAGTLNATQEWDEGSLHVMEHGYTEYYDELADTSEPTPIFVPKKLDGTRRDMTATAIVNGYEYMPDASLDLSHPGCELYKLRFTDSFFDRSNTSIWGNAARLTSYYDSVNTKDFHPAELNQFLLHSWLNDGYKGRLFVKFLSHNFEGDYYGSVEKLHRSKLLEILYYNVNQIGIKQKKILEYTGDILAAVKDDTGKVLYDVNDQVQVGVLQSSKGRLIMRYDDGLYQQYLNWKPLVEQYGGRGVVCLISDFMGTDIYMSAAQALEMQEDGWEMMTHAKDDTDMVAISGEDAAAIIHQVYSDLTALGFNIKNYAGHHTAWHNLYLRKASLADHRSHHIEYDENFSGINPVYMHYTRTWGVGLEHENDPNSPYHVNGTSQFKSLMDRAKNENKILVLVSHHYQYEKSDIAIRDILSYANTINLPIGTWEDAYSEARYLNDNPVILTDADISITEGVTAVCTLSSDRDCTYAKSGGADQSFFTVTSAGVVTITARSFATPEDADLNNIYTVEIIAISALSGQTSVISLNVSITQ